jgi:hypothetical protein
MRLAQALSGHVSSYGIHATLTQLTFIQQSLDNDFSGFVVKAHALNPNTEKVRLFIS